MQSCRKRGKRLSNVKIRRCGGFILPTQVERLSMQIKGQLKAADICSNLLENKMALCSGA